MCIGGDARGTLERRVLARGILFLTSRLCTKACIIPPSKNERFGKKRWNNQTRFGILF